ncbi:MAG: flagellar biosynthetic protein FliO [Lachnospiraceae bacterium]|nr:flagellar biosynthetic protein FliO [Lachnospiraceae bacterium]
MFFVAAGTKGVIESVVQLIVLLAIFAGILFLAYWSSKLTAKFSSKTMQNGNVEIIETIRIHNNKYVQILKIADKYIAVGVGKDEICFLSELSEDAIVRRSLDGKKTDFKEILNYFTQTGEDSKGQDSHALEEDEEEQ